MALKLVPKLSARRRWLLTGACYQPRLSPDVFRGAPQGMYANARDREAADKFVEAATRPYDGKTYVVEKRAPEQKTP